MAMKYYQYDFGDIYGEKWQYNAINPFWEKEQIPEVDGQYSLKDLYNPDILGEETEEEFIRRKMSPLRGWRICTRTVLSGDLVEVDMYPVPSNKKDIPRGRKSRESREAQKNLNNKNRVKEIVRLMCTNFSKEDYICTLSYKDGYLPDENRARKDMKNFLEKVRRRRKKQGLPPLKYIYVIEFIPEGKKTKKVRLHHHIIMSGGLDRDELEGLWGKGRCQVRRCQPDDFELTGFAEYIAKMAADKGKHSYACSRNLKKPKVFKSVTKLSRRKFMEIIRSGDEKGKLLESLYRGVFRYLDSTTYINQLYGGFYLYSRMRRRKSIWKTE